MSDEQHLKVTVETASGDFQPNPIYGDAPPSYAGGTYDNDDDDPNINMQQPQDENYEYPENQAPDVDDDDDDDDDVNNPFNNQPQEQQEDQEYEQDYEMVPQHVQKPPPPYSEDPPQPPPTYNANHVDTQQYDDEPEDVVAQMNAANQSADSDEDVGDYGVTQPKVDDKTDTDAENGVGLFGNFFIRTVFMACSIFICSLFAFAIWFQKIGGDFSAGLGISAFAVVLLFLGSLLAIVFAIMQKFRRPIPAEKWVLFLIVGIYVTGGLFYFLGGCAIAYAWNTIGASYFAGIFFAEQTFVGLHAIIAGVDLWKRKILNNKKWRVIIYNIAFIFVSVIAFFSFAVTSTKFDKAGLDNAGPAFLALFYFLVLIPEILFLVVYLIPKLNEMCKPIVLLILAVVFFLCVICILIGYFIIVFDFEGVKGRAYWLGVGFFILDCGTVIAFDMMFDRFVPGYKDGGLSVSDQDASGGGSSAVAIIDPDDPDDPDYD